VAASRPIIAAALYATARVVDEIDAFVPDLAARARERLQTLQRGDPLIARLDAATP